LKALASEPDPVGGGWTRAGRAFQKHGYRPTGSVYPRVTGPPAHYNAIAQRIVEAIVDDPGRAFRQRLKVRVGYARPFLEVIAADGRSLGYRWEPMLHRYVFEGFREPLAGLALPPAGGGRTP
jgi:hypothetical protein